MSPEEIQELYERRLSEKVETSVNQAIKRRYAWVGAIAIVASWVGGVALIKSMIQTSVDNEVKSAVADHTDEFNDMASKIVQTDLTAQSDLLQLNKAIADVQAQAAETQRQQEQLEGKRKDLDAMLAGLDKTAATMRDEVGRLADKSAQIQQDLAQSDQTVGRIRDQFQGDISALEQAAKRVADLATQVQQLRADVAQLAEGKKIEVSSTSISDVAGIADSVIQSTNALAQPTVYFEFAGEQGRGIAEQIAAKLKESGFRVPGTELVTHRVNEVRYYYDTDRELAQRLADNATAIRTALGVPGGSVTSRDLTGWSKAKPPKNTVELWMDLTQAD